MPPDNPTPQDAYTGLSGFFKQWTGLGVIGVMSGLLVYAMTIQLPGVQDKFHQELREERGAFREEAEKSRKHGEYAVEKLTATMGKHQETVAENQRQMIEIMRQQLKMAKDK